MLHHRGLVTRLKGVDEELPPAPRFRQVHVHVPGILLGLLIGWLAFPPTVHSQRADTTTVFFEHSMPDTPEYRWMKDTVRKELAARFPGRAIRFNSLSRSSSGVALETSIPREYRIVTYYFRKYDGHWEMLPDTRLRQTNDSGKPRPTETTGWMVDTVRAMVAHMKPAPTIGTPRFTGDTAWVGASVSGTHGDAFWVRTITHRFERTDGTWRLSPRFEISIAHGGREPKAPHRTPRRRGQSTRPPSGSSPVRTVSTRRTPSSRCGATPRGYGHAATAATR